jgi:Raf kinase inhibitor-like YbhB/YbcL family protein
MMRSISAVSALILLATTAGASAQTPPQSSPAVRPMHPVIMGVTSSAFEDGGIIPDRFTRKIDPPGKSPPLAWTGAPEGTQSFVLVMHDLDVVMGKTTNDNLHWLAFNIPANVTSLPESVPNVEKLPDGTIQLFDKGAFGYTAPGAPPGVYHHYVFEVWALDAKLDLTAQATRADVLKAMDGHVLDKGTLVGRFHR